MNTYRYFVLLIVSFFSVCLPLFSENTSDINQNRTVLLAVLARNKAHVLPHFFQCIDNMDYDKKLITVYINTNNNQDDTEKLIQQWIETHEKEYQRIIVDKHEVQNASTTRPHEWTAERFNILALIRNKSLQKSIETKSDYYFVVDCDNFIAPCTLKELIAKDKPIIAPMLKPIPERNDLYSNYFCDVSETGYYQDHPDYGKILTRQQKGTYKVPVVHCTYLIKSCYLDKLNYIDGTQDYEFVIFSRMARKNQIDQYICNEKDFGYLLHFHNDLTLDEEKNKVSKIAFEDLMKNCS